MATKELGYTLSPKKPLVAGCSSDIIVVITTKSGGEERAPFNVTGDDIESVIGPEVVGTEAVQYTIQIAPDNSGTTEIVVSYNDSSPSTIIAIPVMGPMVTYPNTPIVEVGQRSVTFNGTYLNGCVVELQPSAPAGCRIIRQKNLGDSIVVEFVANQPGNFPVQLSYGRQTRGHILTTEDGQDLQITFNAPPRRNHRWIIPVAFLVIAVGLLSITFFGSC